MPSFLQVLATSTLAAALVSPAPAGAQGLDAVNQYISGWKMHNGRQVQSAFTPDGTYRDPDTPQTRRGDSIAAYVEQYADARFELLGFSTLGNGDMQLNWAVHWPDARGASQYVDIVRLQDGRIRSVSSTGTPDPASQSLIAAYIVLHREPTHASIAALFTPHFVVLSSKSPPGGRRGDDYLQFLKRFSWARFTQDADSPLLQTKDHRIALQWSMRFWGFRLAQGVDYLTLEGGRISKIVAIY